MPKHPACEGGTEEEYAELGICDLLILDVMIPKLNGYELAKRVRLSSKEFDIRRFLLQTGEKNLSKEVIPARVWGHDSKAVENHVEVYIRFLRKKLASIGSTVRITALRKLGYHLEIHDEN